MEKPTIRITRNCIGVYKYKHVKGDLSLITESEQMAFGGYLVYLTIGLTLFERFAR